MKIQFREIGSLGKVAFSYQLKQCRPGRMCTSSSASSSSSNNMLVYVDHKKHPHEVQWLDCSKSPPEPAEEPGSVHVQHDLVWDLCCAFVRNGKQRLLITTGGFDGINGHNAGTDKLEWSLKGGISGVEDEMTAEGVTSNGRGHLFVCDENNKCVHVFTTSGDLVGTVLREGEQGLGRPRLIHWCDGSSSLIVGHIIDEYYCISQIEVAQEVVTTSGEGTNQDAVGDDPAAEEDNDDTEPVIVTRRQTRSLTRAASKNSKTKSKGRKGRKKNVDSVVDKTRQLDEIESEKANQNEETGNVDKAEVPLKVSVTDEDVDLFFESLAEDPPPTKARQTSTKQGDSAESLSNDRGRRTRSQKHQASTKSDRDAQDRSGRRREKSAELVMPAKARRDRASSEPHDVIVTGTPASDHRTSHLSSDAKNSKSKRGGINYLFIWFRRSVQMNMTSFGLLGTKI